MYKIAITAGHYLGTAGKRCLKALDPNETREWVLNDRIVRKIIELLKEYEGYEILRTDDPTGKTQIDVEDRCKAANDFGADDYFSVHHNASGVNGFTGGGIVVYIHPAAKEDTKTLQKMLYEALIEETGLKGNRATPLATANLAECRLTAMPAVLGELGFMDSPIDVPIILSEEHADACARAYVKVMVKRGNLKKKVVEQPKEEAAQPAPVDPEEELAAEEPDYLERMKAEYRELKERYEKLHSIIVRYEAGTLDFTPTCPIELLKKQARAMGEYLYVLEVRAAMEGVAL
ncbi:MAG: N-acetylmuramoyl-L-alanine amidase [Clostridia bacterium]|nr:N-acetylmuramoyl-L-alanine amidase [Clostridia bacterium]